MFPGKRSFGWLVLALAGALSLALMPLGVAGAIGTSGPNPHALQQAFSRASEEFGVPRSVLLSVSYNETRWEQHHGQPSTSGAYGVMALTDVPGAAYRAPAFHTLNTAAKLLGSSPDVLRHSAAQNVRGGAALLAEYARETVGGTPSDPAQWYGAVVKYSGSQNADVAYDFADQVYKTIRSGAARTTMDGQSVTLAAQPVSPNTATADPLGLQKTKSSNKVDCPSNLGCQWVAAASSGYGTANRPKDGLTIDYIVIHDTEESYTDTINQFATKGSCCSANYVIRSSDGQITQMVDNRNISYHAGNYYINLHSIGIEHEGVAIEGASWYTEPMYRMSARLVAYLAHEYNVPLNRDHIIGHDNVPGPTDAYQAGMHWDPGPYWDWAHYMALLGAPISATGSSSSRIVTINPDFQTNQPEVSYCFDDGCRDVPPQPSNFVYLYTAPSFDAPLLSDPYLHTDGSPGTTRAYDWGDKAVTGQSFYVVGRQGDWTEINYAGQNAWFYNPGASNAVPTSGTLVTPKAGAASAPVFGRAYPESSGAVVPFSKYSIPAGQYYPITGLYYANYFPGKYVQGPDQYYQISFNHRIMYVRTTDVDVVSSP